MYDLPLSNNLGHHLPDDNNLNWTAVILGVSLVVLIGVAFLWAVTTASQEDEGIYAPS